MHSSTLYATLRLKRRPISNAIICFKLTVAHALPVHKHALHERDITDHATLRDVNAELAALAQQYKCSNVELDAKRDVVARLERNAA
jgi:transcriptional regulator of NAD metabolism